jgi:hypothetical protein
MLEMATVPCLEPVLWNHSAYMIRAARCEMNKRVHDTLLNNGFDNEVMRNNLVLEIASNGAVHVQNTLDTAVRPMRTEYAEDLLPALQQRRYRVGPKLGRNEK